MLLCCATVESAQRVYLCGYVYGEETIMLDYYNASKIARAEYEERVRSLTPVQGHEIWLTDERQLSIWPIRAGLAVKSTAQANWMGQQVGRMLDLLGNNLIATGEWIRQRRA
jgi:hypothetical protein